MADKTFTVAQLAHFDGKKEAKIYVALNFKVYDVTEKGATHYGKGGQYEQFAGKDLSRAMASMQMETPDTFDDLSDLSPEQRQKLHEWVSKFEGRYDVVGTLVR